MRLLNVHTYRSVEFHADYVPPYAILSHTWHKEEVTLQDLGHGLPNQLRGAQKMAGCCQRASDDGLDYVVSLPAIKLC
jgi:hypothetical protein